MGFGHLETLSIQWKQLAAKAKNSQHIAYSELLEVFKATHKAVSSLHETNLVPRKACQVIMLMDEFTYYAAMMDENYLGDICSGLYYLNYALKNEFFKGKYQSEFFLGPKTSQIKQYVLDIENIGLDDFVRFLKDQLGKDYNDVVLANNKK
ncbi:MAG: hypothetical protein E7539_06330 [Ruminococcaceae bacterium]|nr:hypothetical protein [Oscillospiraceae bacterium]